MTLELGHQILDNRIFNLAKIDPWALHVMDVHGYLSINNSDSYINRTEHVYISDICNGKGSSDDYCDFVVTHDPSISSSQYRDAEFTACIKYNYFRSRKYINGVTDDRNSVGITARYMHGRGGSRVPHDHYGLYGNYSGNYNTPLKTVRSNYYSRTESIFTDITSSTNIFAAIIDLDDHRINADLVFNKMYLDSHFQFSSFIYMSPDSSVNIYNDDSHNIFEPIGNDKTLSIWFSHTNQYLKHIDRKPFIDGRPAYCSPLHHSFLVLGDHIANAFIERFHNQEVYASFCKVHQCSSNIELSYLDHELDQLFAETTYTLFRMSPDNTYNYMCISSILPTMSIDVDQVVKAIRYFENAVPLSISTPRIRYNMDSFQRYFVSYYGLSMNRKCDATMKCMKKIMNDVMNNKYVDSKHKNVVFGTRDRQDCMVSLSALFVPYTQMRLLSIKNKTDLDIITLYKVFFNNAVGGDYSYYAKNFLTMCNLGHPQQASSVQEAKFLLQFNVKTSFQLQKSYIPTKVYNHSTDILLYNRLNPYIYSCIAVSGLLGLIFVKMNKLILDHLRDEFNIRDSFFTTWLYTVVLGRCTPSVEGNVMISLQNTNEPLKRSMSRVVTSSYRKHQKV